MFITPMPARQLIKPQQASPSSTRQGKPAVLQSNSSTKFGMQSEVSRTGAARRHQPLQSEIREIQEEEPASQPPTIPPGSLNIALAYREGAKDDEPPLLILLPSAQNIDPNLITYTHTPFAPPKLQRHRGDMLRVLGGFATAAIGTSLAIYGSVRPRQNLGAGTILGALGQLVGVIGGMIGGISGIRALWRMCRPGRHPQRDPNNNV